MHDDLSSLSGEHFPPIIVLFTENDRLYSLQSVDDARELLRRLDPSLGKPLPERSYANDCRVYTPEDPVSNFRNIWVKH